MTDPSIPTLVTERLLLRPPQADDFPAFARFLASPRAVHYLGGPHGERAAWGLFCQDVACWRLFGHGALMIDLPREGVCVGQASISAGPRFPEPELGWLVYEPHEGHGYATEAAAALRDWAASKRGLDRLVSYMDPENARSIAVARRLGAVLDTDAVPQDPGDLVFRHRPSAA